MNTSSNHRVLLVFLHLGTNADIVLTIQRVTEYFHVAQTFQGGRIGGAVGSGTAAQTGRSRVRFPTV